MKRFTYFLLAIVIITCCMSNAVKELNYFVATHGSDHNTGTEYAPFASVRQALEVVSELRRQGEEAKINIHIQGGTYYISQTMHISKEVYNVSILAEKSENVIFNGGKSIPAEHMIVKGVTDKSSKTYEVDLNKAGIDDFGSLRNVGFARPYGNTWGEIFVNKKPMHLSRWPNHGAIPMGKVLDAGSVPRNDDFSNRGGIIHYDSVRINNWANEPDAWMSGYFMWGYADDMVKIAEIDTENQTITTASPTLYGYGYDKPWRRWYGVNIKAELDEPDEYYVDRESGILQFISAEDTIHSLEFSLLEGPFITVDGAQNISISGITFECSRSMGISLSNTEHVKIEDCEFRNLGSVGISVGKGVEPFEEYRHDGTGTPKIGILGSLQQHLYTNTTFNREAGRKNVITGCTFYNLGAGGISLGGGDRKTLASGGNVVENCKFYAVNRIEKSYRPAIDLMGVGNQIRHCEIFNTPSMAIFMHGNNHLIEYNYIHDVCQEVEDQGAIYYGRDPSELGTIIRYNYFENIPDQYNTCAVYIDDGACGLTVSGNVFYKAGKWNVLIGGGSFNTFNNNIFIESRYGIHVDNRMQNWAKAQLDSGGIFERRLAAVNYLQPPYVTCYPHLTSFLADAAIPKKNMLTNNVFVAVKNLVDGKMAWLVYDKSNLSIDKDPGFENWHGKDFRLKNDSKVYKKLQGFEHIPFDKIGLVKE